jgi:hypothetical protein
MSNSLIPFEQIGSLLQQGQIARVEINPSFQDPNSRNTLLTFYGHNGQYWLALVSYDARTNQIFPPINSQPAPAPKVPEKPRIQVRQLRDSQFLVEGSTLVIGPGAEPGKYGALGSLQGNTIGTLTESDRMVAQKFGLI